jgi:hypothetical protein
VAFQFGGNTAATSFMRRDNPFALTIVPNHKQIDRGTLRAILRQTELSVEEFIKLL